MVVGRALRAIGCAGCRLTLIRSFVSLPNLSIRVPQSVDRSHIPRRTQRIQYSSRAAGLGVNNHDDSSKYIEEEKKDGLGEGIEDTREVGSTHISNTPWYLQVDSPQRAPRPISERQRIPDLPENAPPVLAPLMQQVSIDLGLDDLTLLDLRGLDPPPALGANLLMLIGTARSEKHLHVSADRLCRWLRSTYKLKPDADGLLGRNELKLKLKRKAKRAKLMGSAADDNNDDGVRTGWVCVDIGVVAGAEGMPELAPLPKTFVGFGRRTEDVRIVVQMLTEEKRADINLEKLWTGILDRGSPKKIEEETVGEISEQTDHHFPVSTNASSQSPMLARHSRGYHSTARRLNVAEAPFSALVTPLHTDSTTNPFPAHDLQAIYHATKQDLASGNYERARSSIIRCSQSIQQLQNENWRPFLLRMLGAHLQSLPASTALEMLGNGDSDSSSTPFLLCFYETLSPTYRSMAEIEMLVWLIAFAQDLGHPGYDYLKLLDIFDESRAAGVKISVDSYSRMLRVLLNPTGRQSNYFGPSEAVLAASLDILQAMHDQGLDILSEDILVELQELTMLPRQEDVPQHKIYTDPQETFDLPSVPMAPISCRFHSLVLQLELPFFRDDSRMRLMELYASHDHWQEFWDIFRMAPRRNKPQSASMYAFMLFHIAQSKHQKACMTVLRTWSVDLQHEDPLVELKEDVSQALKACLVVADPHVQQDAQDPEARGEWVSLWRKCL